MKSAATISVLLGFIGMAGFGFLAMNSQDDMPGCLFTGHTMLCNMNVIEHISLWQSILVATLQKTSILVLLLVLVFAVELFIFRRYLFHVLRLGTSFLKQVRNLQKNDVFFDPVKYALAKGILHSRIYEFATL